MPEAGGITFRGVSRRRQDRWLGLSRNKVSLRERGDGSPPFYGESLSTKKSMCKFIKPINLDFIPDVEVDNLFSFERIEFS